jgi:hypothetical protein
MYDVLELAIPTDSGSDTTLVRELATPADDCSDTIDARELALPLPGSDKNDALELSLALALLQASLAMGERVWPRLSVTPGAGLP